MQSVSTGEIVSFQESFLRAVVAAVVSAEIAFKEAEEQAARRLRELTQQEEDQRRKLEADERKRNLESGMQISMGDTLLFGYAGGSKIDTLSGMAGKFYNPGLPKTLDALKNVSEGSALPHAADLRIDFAGKPVLQTDAEGTVLVNKFIGAGFESNYFASFFKVRDNSSLSEEPRRIIEELNRGKQVVVEPVKEAVGGSVEEKQSAVKRRSRAVATPEKSVPSPSFAPILEASQSFQSQPSQSSQSQSQSQSSQSQSQSQPFQSKLSQFQPFQSESSQSESPQSSQSSQPQSWGSDSRLRYVVEHLVEFSASVGTPVEVKGTHYIWKATPDGRCRIDDPNRRCLLIDDGCGNFRSRMTEADLERFEKALPELMKMKPIQSRPYESNSKQSKKPQLEL
ncbi:MAG: hypothetical protein JGK24_14475 [Microcoleus sp. PH2017_29_MFU_D_A]|uniref:hypothetical protein n=1 Tax=unclassified Microcoleus TaxID=2642155 RepID=UPI001DB763AC|nr:MULTISPECIES: hypothetical protein [unclassified Microcoleus]MCC3422172.1 hypothetical protein [Microcoleus sp. PH2017_07_MST_O_A]MCC3507612.1 hypothetical protein [Microcoleus sp. PH2017_17_BER_D_A]TAG69192.1 MAG: hypothetical protein EAZ25_00320 [Oscillatoriales cyanobacterium]MCC3422370.1 hypothetical protein [Microcoleus sp. PH2017_01_SCD_O_A]MCC3452124.1 hypothetical protein [Microcoleus sp. PH2017_08_TRC_O_A]